jgi:hypothetical protein
MAQSLMYKAKKKRKAKPVLVQDFSRLEGVDLLETLKNDKDKLVSHTFTSQSYGGANKLWQLDELEGLVVTVSTGSIGREKINPSMDLPCYIHFVLTQEGVQWVQGILLENA